MLTYTQKRLQQIARERAQFPALSLYRKVLTTAELEEEARRQTITRVYVFPARGIVKIGVAWDVQVRWKNIRCGNPFLEPALFVSEPLGQRARELEKEAHRRLEAYRIRGTEWFKCNRYFAAAIVQELILVSQQ